MAPELQDHVLSFAGHHALKKIRLAAGRSHSLYEQAVRASRLFPQGEPTHADALLLRFQQTTRLFHTLDLTTLAQGDPLPDRKLRKCFERLDVTTYAKVRVLEVCISSAPATEGEHPDIYARYALAILQRLSDLHTLILRIRYCASLTSAPWVRYFLQTLAAMEPKFEIGLAYNPDHQVIEHALARHLQPTLQEILTTLSAVPFTFMHIEFHKPMCEDLLIARVPLRLSSLTLRAIRGQQQLVVRAWDRFADTLTDLTCIRRLSLDWSGSGDSEVASGLLLCPTLAYG